MGIQSFLDEVNKLDFKVFHVVKLNLHEIDTIVQSTMKSLNLNTINELRDRFEGVAFYKKFQKKISGLIALEKFLKTRLIDWSTLDPKTFNPIINIQGRIFEVLVTDFGELPIVNYIPEHPILLIIRKEEVVFWIVGVNDNVVFTELNAKNVNGITYQINSLSGFNQFEDYSTLAGLGL